MQDHRVRSFVDKIKVMSGELLDKYHDADGSRREEVATMKGDHVFKNFYARLTSIRDYHARFPGSGRPMADPAVSRGPVRSASAVTRPWLAVSHGRAWHTHTRASGTTDTGSAGRGAAAHVLRRRVCGAVPGPAALPRALLQLPWRAVRRPCIAPCMAASPGSDPHRHCHHHACRVDYQGFLDKVGDLASFPLKHKNQAYAKFVEELAAYLRGFFQRTSPLVDLAPLMSRLRAQFETAWQAGELPGWGAAADGDDEDAKAADDLFCAPCNRRFTKATVFAAHQKSKKHKRVVARQAAANDGADAGAGAGAGGGGSADGAGGGRQSTHVRCAWAEMQVRRMLELLSDVMDTTKRQVEKKQTRTFQELEVRG